MINYGNWIRTQKWFNKLDSDGVVYVVDPNGNGDFDTIQGAIDAVSASSAYTFIMLAPGDYSEADITINKSNITIWGAGKTATQVGDNSGSIATFVISSGTNIAFYNMWVRSLTNATSFVNNGGVNVSVHDCRVDQSFQGSLSTIKFFSLDSTGSGSSGSIHNGISVASFIGRTDTLAIGCYMTPNGAGSAGTIVSSNISTNNGIIGTNGEAVLCFLEAGWNGAGSADFASVIYCASDAAISVPPTGSGAQPTPALIGVYAPSITLPAVSGGLTPLLGGYTETLTNALQADVKWNEIPYYFRSAHINLIPLKVRAKSSQAANLTQWEDSIGTPLAAVAAGGQVLANSGLAYPRRTVSFADAIGLRDVVITDYTLRVDASGGSFDVTVPDTAVSGIKDGQVFTIKRIDTTGANTVNILRNGADLIDGATSIPVGIKEAFKLQENGVDGYDII